MDKELYYQGARIAAIAMRERLFAGGCKPKGDDWVYFDAEYALLIKNRRNLELWLSGAEVSFRNHKRDSKGKLVSCEAYFTEFKD